MKTVFCGPQREKNHDSTPPASMRCVCCAPLFCICIRQLRHYTFHKYLENDNVHYRNCVGFRLAAAAAASTDWRLQRKLTKVDQHSSTFFAFVLYCISFVYRILFLFLFFIFCTGASMSF